MSGAIGQIRLNATFADSIANQATTPNRKPVRDSCQTSRPAGHRLARKNFARLLLLEVSALPYTVEEFTDHSKRISPKQEGSLRQIAKSSALPA
jgi:hypothetical protein